MVTLLLWETEGTREIDKLLEGDPLRWPLIKAAERTLARSTKIEWMIDKLDPCPHCGAPHLEREIEHNYMQVIRTPFDASKVAKLSALEQHLDQIEYALRDGHRELHLTGRVWSMMGGVFELLRRWPHKEDMLCLRILRPTVLLDRQEPGRPGTHEWLTELTLEARRGSNTSQRSH